MAELMYAHLPDIEDDELTLKPPIANRRRLKEIRFGAPDRFTRFNERDVRRRPLDRCMVDTAREFEAGRGHTFQSVHGSEVAFWPDLKRKLTSLLNAVDSDDPDTLDPAGVDGQRPQRVQGAVGPRAATARTTSTRSSPPGTRTRATARS